MTAIAEVKKDIQVEEVSFEAAVGEATFNKIGGSINFINNRQYDTKKFFLNGPYSIGAGDLGVDGLYIFPYNVEIFDVGIFNLVSGSSGTTELDIKRATSSGGAFTSIFSTTPKIASTSGNNAFALSGDTPPTGFTLPVLTSSPFNVDAGDALRLDLISAMTAAENCGLTLYFRPR